MMLLYLADKNKSKIIEKTKIILESKLKQEPNLFKLSLNAKEFEDNSLQELLQSNALFKANYIVVLNDIFEEKDAKDKFFNFLDELAISAHLFILQDSFCALSEKELELLKKKSFKADINCSKRSMKPDKNAFYLADAFLLKNKKDFWLEFLKLSEDFDAEQLYGILNWAFKNIFLFENKPSSLKPYLAKKYARIFQINDKEKLRRAYLDFLDLPSRARKAKLNLKDELEKWILSLNIKNN